MLSQLFTGKSAANGPPSIVAAAAGHDFGHGAGRDGQCRDGARVPVGQAPKATPDTAAPTVVDAAQPRAPMQCPPSPEPGLTRQARHTRAAARAADEAKRRGVVPPHNPGAAPGPPRCQWPGGRQLALIPGHRPGGCCGRGSTGGAASPRDHQGLRVSQARAEGPAKPNSSQRAPRGRVSTFREHIRQPRRPGPEGRLAACALAA